MLVEEILTRSPIGFTWDSPLEDVKKYLSQESDSHICITADGYFLGCISRELIVYHSINKLSEICDALENFYVQNSHQVLDAIPIMSTYHANIIPVLGDEGEYLGNVYAQDVLDELATFPVFKENGVVILISSTQQEFSMSKITQIIEAENAKIFAVQISKWDETDVEVMLKISLRNVQNAIDSLQRFGYTLLYSSHLDRRKETFKNRLDFVQKYLEI